MSGEWTPERWSRAEAVFHRVQALPEADQDAAIGRECGSDATLRADVEMLLAADRNATSFLDGPPAWLDVGDPAPPSHIGPYRVVRLLGRGGMGSVYLAAREGEDVDHLVAVKVIRRGLDTDDVLARFRRERRILARLHHPNIARLFDVGSTVEGLPYYVMEHVEGVPLLEHCERRGLGVRARLELFRTVCAAVHHAHRNLVVHRDLKPGNILVTPEGAPKLLDFGIARLLDDEGSDPPTDLTRVGVRVLTPGYAAPEQVEGTGVTTASDVWALGVLLHELLTGTRPGEAGTADALEGELATIVRAATRPEPEARYPSALSLGEDVERHLAGLPLRARPATLGYQLRKFLGRHRAIVASASALVLVLVAATALATHQAQRIRDEAERVARERDKALQVQAVLLEMFGTTGPDQPTGDTVTARELLDRRAATLERTYPDDPEMRAELQAVLAEGYEKLGLLDHAEPLARAALVSRRGLFGDRHPDVMVSLNLLGWILHERGRIAEAEPLLEEAVTVGREVFGDEGSARLARALNDLGVVREANGEYDRAAELYRESLEMRRRHQGEAHQGVATTLSNLSVVHYRRGDLDAAASAAREALAAFERVLGPDHQRALIVRSNLAAFESARGDHDAAARQHADLLERRRRIFGPSHPSVAFSLNQTAFELMHLERLDEAEALLLEALELRRAGAGAGQENLAVTLRLLGDVLGRTGRAAEAGPLYDEAIMILETHVGAHHRDLPYLRAARAEIGGA